MTFNFPILKIIIIILWVPLILHKEGKKWNVGNNTCVDYEFLKGCTGRFSLFGRVPSHKDWHLVKDRSISEEVWAKASLITSGWLRCNQVYRVLLNFHIKVCLFVILIFFLSSKESHNRIKLSEKTLLMTDTFQRWNRHVKINAMSEETGCSDNELDLL